MNSLKGPEILIALIIAGIQLAVPAPSPAWSVMFLIAAGPLVVRIAWSATKGKPRLRAWLCFAFLGSVLATGVSYTARLGKAGNAAPMPSSSSSVISSTGAPREAGNESVSSKEPSVRSKGASPASTTAVHSGASVQKLIPSRVRPNSPILIAFGQIPKLPAALPAGNPFEGEQQYLAQNVPLPTAPTAVQPNNFISSSDLTARISEPHGDMANDQVVSRNVRPEAGTSTPSECTESNVRPTWKTAGSQILCLPSSTTHTSQHADQKPDTKCNISAAEMFSESGELDLSRVARCLEVVQASAGTEKTVSIESIAIISPPINPFARTKVIATRPSAASSERAKDGK
jgi:hypothetical protein